MIYILMFMFMLFLLLVALFFKEFEAKVANKEHVPERFTSKTTVHMPFMITRDMHQQLADLGYSREERNNMTPSEAHNILRGE